MSLKENMKVLKEELSAEEQILESVIKAEGFWKKYKKIILTLLTVVFLAIAWKLISEYLHQQSLEKANLAYNQLMTNPNDADAKARLKSENPKLYELFTYQQVARVSDPAKLETSLKEIKDPNLRDLLTYQIASLKKSGLSSYATKEGAILRDLARYQSAYLLLKEGKIKEAQAKLAQISQQSALYPLAQNLKNYQGK